ncbi:hypothetical protein C9926_01385 [Sulfurovum lithotrophicum]|nr:hypothetical protein C9926_01385 [Sulfurovum lithotrophicum]
MLHAGISTVNILPASEKKVFMHIKILDQKQLSFDTIQDITFAELSDLAYDAQTQTLYLISDKGLLYAFNAHFSDKIDMLIPLRATKLKNKRAKRFKKWKRDSEGLTLDGKGRLLISFEGKAKIGWFHKNSASFGHMIRKYKMPKVLKNPKNYRSKNKSLESLAWHPKYGILTATEWPLKRDDKKRQTIYALSGKKWHFKAEPEGRSGLVAMEVMDDGNVLVMERSYTGLLNPFIVTLKKVYINGCTQAMCKTKILAKMSNHSGWDLDNFEGLARVGKNRYVMISDDNGNFFQRTLLIYFEVIDE